MEIVDIINKQDEVVGQKTRKESHAQHLLHRSVHVMILNSEREILLQLRKRDKRNYPLFWSCSVGGHVYSGEKPEEAVYREMQEEIGIRTDLEFVGKFIVDDATEYEMVFVYFGKFDGPFVFQEEEMEKAQFFSVKNLWKEKTEMNLTPHCSGALEMIKDKLPGI
ncbi:MAG: NUDIX domain-containing protein [bacterium]|nr:NUDIX domain-containing protein [bacterium]